MKVFHFDNGEVKWPDWDSTINIKVFNSPSFDKVIGIGKIIQLSASSIKPDAKTWLFFEEDRWNAGDTDHYNVGLGLINNKIIHIWLED